MNLLLNCNTSFLDYLNHVKPGCIYPSSLCAILTPAQADLGPLPALQIFAACPVAIILICWAFFANFATLPQNKGSLTRKIGLIDF